MKKTPVRRRITPTVPFVLKVEDSEGTQNISLQLAYDFNCFCLVEEKLGNKTDGTPWSMLTDVGEILDNPSVKNVSILLWAAVQLNHEGEFGGDDGLWAIRNLLTIPQAQSALDKCAEAFMKQLPAERVEELKKIRAAREAGEQAPPLEPSPAPTE